MIEERTRKSSRSLLASDLGPFNSTSHKSWLLKHKILNSQSFWLLHASTIRISHKKAKMGLCVSKCIAWKQCHHYWLMVFVQFVTALEVRTEESSTWCLKGAAPVEAETAAQVLKPGKQSSLHPYWLALMTSLRFWHRCIRRGAVCAGGCVFKAL